MLIYAQPISRGSILVSSFLSQVLVLFVYNLGLWSVSYGIAAMQPEFDAGPFALACLTLHSLILWWRSCIYPSATCCRYFYPTPVRLPPPRSRCCWLLCCLVLWAARFRRWAGCCFISIPLFEHRPDYRIGLVRRAAGLFPYVLICLIFSLIFGALSCVRYYFKDFNV